MAKRNDLRQQSEDLASFIDKNPEDTGRKGRDVSSEPRVPEGQPGGGEWTKNGDTAPSDEDMRGQCPNGYDVVPMLVTGYSNDKESTGKSPGDPGYGQASDRTMTKPGTLAASRDYDFGTRMYVPGYGWGTVHDRGGKIKGNHIDLWFKTAEEAKKWGKRAVDVIVCRK